MGNQDIHLLCTGDLHLGRHPGGIPEGYDSRGFSPTAIWNKIIEKALEREVDVLIMSGDIIDRNNRYFEAFGPLEAGIKKLAENNIGVFAVAGNHDYDILPRLAKNISTENFCFLGAGGKWEEKTLNRNGKPLLNIVGWSYPAGHVRQSPLSTLQKLEEDIPAVGLLHSEINNPASIYAPVSVAKLQESNLKGWILGHIHREYLISEVSSFILNPGSPQPLHSAETGIHNVHEVIIKSSGGYEINKYPLASLYYLNLEIDISTLEEITDLPAWIANGIEDEMDYEGDISWMPELIITRIILTGRTSLIRKIETARRELQELELSVSGSQIIIDRIENKTGPLYDLEKLADGNSQVALLAEYLLKLEAGNEEELPERLLKKIEDKLLSVYNAHAYQPLHRYNRIQPPGRDKILSVLQKQAALLLESLLSQKEESL